MIYKTISPNNSGTNQLYIFYANMLTLSLILPLTSQRTVFFCSHFNNHQNRQCLLNNSVYYRAQNILLENSILFPCNTLLNYLTFQCFDYERDLDEGYSSRALNSISTFLLLSLGRHLGCRLSLAQQSLLRHSHDLLTIFNV